MLPNTCQKMITAINYLAPGLSTAAALPFFHNSQRDALYPKLDYITSLP